MKYFEKTRVLTFLQTIFLLSLISCGGSGSPENEGSQSTDSTTKNLPISDGKKTDTDNNHKEIEPLPLGSNVRYATVNGTIEVLEITQEDSHRPVGPYYEIKFNFIMDESSTDPDLIKKISEFKNVNQSRVIYVRNAQPSTGIDIVKECLEPNNIREGTSHPGVLHWAISGTANPQVYHFKDLSEDKCFF